MSNKITATRVIGIDMGHRVPDHASKCCNVHGHRYSIELTCEGDLISNGEQAGMVMDFGFMKNIMMDTIDKFFDHGSCYFCKDPLVDKHYTDRKAASVVLINNGSIKAKYYEKQHTGGFEFGKVVLINAIPTAENLAILWKEMLFDLIPKHSEGKAQFKSIRVYETPNGFVDVI